MTVLKLRLDNSQQLLALLPVFIAPFVFRVSLLSPVSTYEAILTPRLDLTALQSLHDPSSVPFLSPISR